MGGQSNLCRLGALVLSVTVPLVIAVVLLQTYRALVDHPSREPSHALARDRTLGHTITDTPIVSTQRENAPGPPSRERDDTVPSAVIRTVDAFSTLVPNAEVVWLSDEGGMVVPLGTTDTRGEVTITGKLPLDGVLVARAHTYSLSEVPVPSTHWSEVEVVLDRGATIEGRLVEKDTRNPRSGRIIAWPSSLRFPPHSIVRRALMGDIRCRIAHASDDGLFQLTNLVRGERYSLAAGARGLATEQVLDFVPAGAEDVEITLARLFGVRVQLKCVSPSDQARVQALIPPTRDPFRWPQDIPIHVIPQPSFAVELAGLPPASSYGSAYDWTRLCTGPSANQAIGPVGFELELFGFERLSADVWLMPAEDHLELFELPLRARAENTGLLQVVFDHIPPLPKVAHLRQAWDAHLALVTPGNLRASLRVESLAGGQALFSLPQGEYKVAFGILSSTLRIPESSTDWERISISNQSSSWTVDLRDTGIIDMALWCPNQQPYSGPVTLYRIEGEDDRASKSAPVAFDGPPYVLGPVRSGRHTLILLHPRSEEFGAAGTSIVDVAPGTTTRVEFEVGVSSL
jgi:hypothetical protein